MISSDHFSIQDGRLYSSNIGGSHIERLVIHLKRFKRLMANEQNRALLEHHANRWLKENEIPLRVSVERTERDLVFNWRFAYPNNKEHML